MMISLFFTFSFSLHIDAYINTETEAFLRVGEQVMGVALRWDDDSGVSHESDTASGLTPRVTGACAAGFVIKQAHMGRTGLEANWPRAPPPPTTQYSLGDCADTCQAWPQWRRGACESRGPRVCPWGSVPT